MGGNQSSAGGLPVPSRIPGVQRRVVEYRRGDPVKREKREFVSRGDLEGRATGQREERGRRERCLCGLNRYSDSPPIRRPADRGVYQFGVKRT